MVGKKRFGAPMTKRMLDARKKRLLLGIDEDIMDIPSNQMGQLNVNKIVKAYEVRRNGIQVQQSDNREP